ncbi:MAG: hypothetical protein QXU18_07160 [Thermoplasmatales archaeon]
MLKGEVRFLGLTWTEMHFAENLLGYWKLSSTNVVKVNFKGRALKFVLERHSDYSSFYQVYVERSYDNLVNAIRQGDVVLDAGANIGISPCLLPFWSEMKEVS